LALAADVQKIASTMAEYETLESLLRREEESSDNKVTGKIIELKSSIKKLMSQPEVLESLNRLQVQGEPVWGLSSEERELIMLAREIVNEC
jgi:glutamine amidotransferase PdxT